MTTQLSWLQKNLASTPSRAERLALVERETSELPLNTQADLLSLSRSSLYYLPVPVSAEEVALRHAIDEIYTRYPFYGSRRVTVELRQNRQIKVARETVQRYMREIGISASVICTKEDVTEMVGNKRVTVYYGIGDGSDTHGIGLLRIDALSTPRPTPFTGACLVD